jgi:hypothetical protein
MLMYGSDFPHRYPDARDGLLASLPADAAPSVLGGVASEWFGLAR